MTIKKYSLSEMDMDTFEEEQAAVIVASDNAYDRIQPSKALFERLEASLASDFQDLVAQKGVRSIQRGVVTNRPYAANIPAIKVHFSDLADVQFPETYQEVSSDFGFMLVEYN